jgi:uncharacterized protein (UPF0548 family)
MGKVIKLTLKKVASLIFKSNHLYQSLIPIPNNYVKVVGMEEKQESLTATFGTLEGHLEKGKITFRLNENKDGSITFSIDSLSEIDNPFVKAVGQEAARDEQKQSWKEVLKKIEDYLGGDTKKKETK